MQLIDGTPIYSATDLVGFLACEHLTALERAALRGLVVRPNRTDPELEIIRRRGLEHEARYLAELRDRGLGIVSIEPDAYDVERQSYAAIQSPKFTGQFPFTERSGQVMVEQMLAALEQSLSKD